MSDLRTPALGAVAWLTAVVAERSGGSAWIVLAVVVVGATAVARLRPASRPTVLGWSALAVAVLAGITLRVQAVADSPVTALARDHATVTGRLVVTGDPRVVHGRFGDRTMFRARVVRVSGRGRTYAVRAPVVVFGPSRSAGTPDPWQSVRFGSTLGFAGRLAPDDGGDAGLLSVRGPPEVLSGPAWPLRAADRLRAGIRDAVGDPARPGAALVPALVDGDDTGLSADLADDFKTTGLTHLLAVSGTNLTLVAGFALLLARWIGVRARGLTVVGMLAIAGFVLLARSEPSVLRAAAMGTVGLLAFGNGGARRAPRALGVCVVALMLLDPALATTAGFALSALATAGIVFLAPRWGAAMRRWLPGSCGWVAEAVAVPTAAQLACTPVVAAISGQVSVVAVVANLLAGPVVAIATVLGLCGGAVDIAVPVVGRWVALPAVWSGDWIVAVARRMAALPVAAGTVPTSMVALTLLTVASVLAVPLLGWLFARRTGTCALCCIVAVAALVRVPTFGWPPHGWVLFMCDVGQGDGMVLRAGPQSYVVVDTGPDPAPMATCLRRLHVHDIPLVVLTHFHADHIGGLSAVLSGHDVGAIEVSPYADPAYGADEVRALAAKAHVPVVTAQFGETRTLGALTWQVLAPSEPAPADSDSPPNDDSVVMYVRTRGVSILMMGDEETGSQEHLHALFPGLRADVLKVAHHGSAKQDPDLVRSLGAGVGLISVGEGNDYGHPAPSLLTLLRGAHIRPYRTDLDGSIAVVVRSGEVFVRHR